MGRRSERKRGPRRRQRGTEPVENPFEALDLVYPHEPIPEDEQTPEHRARVESAHRLLNRDQLDRARRTLKEPEPEIPEEPEPALVRHYNYRREQHKLEQERARELIAYSEAHPEEFWAETDALLAPHVQGGPVEAD